MSKDCPLLAAPKPVAVMYGIANDNLLFFDTPQSEGLRVNNDSGKVGRIRIFGGTMTTEEVIHELQWLVQGDHQWDVSPSTGNSFRVVYPTKLDFA